MEKYIYDTSNGLWYELHGDYYIPYLALDDNVAQLIIGLNPALRFIFENVIL